MIQLTMKRKNLFIKDEKNLLRTLNTYANYQETITLNILYMIDLMP
jgi:hypothetical protein